MTREALHKLVDELSDEELRAAARLLQLLQQKQDPVLVSLMNAPLDDETETAEEAEAVAEARAELARGEGIPHEVVRRELGL